MFKKYLEQNNETLCSKFKKVIKALFFKLSLFRPISKREFLNHRYELATLVHYVKEIEFINRNDIMLTMGEVAKLHDKEPEVKKNINKKRDGDSFYA